MIRKELIAEMKGSEKHIISCVIWQWIALIAQITVVVFMCTLIQRVYMATAGADDFLLCTAVVICAMIIKYICSVKSADGAFNAGTDVKSRLRERIFSKIVALGKGYRQQASTSEVIQSAVEGVEQLEVYYSRYLPQLFYAILAPLTLFAVFATMNIKTAIVLLICVPLIPVSIIAVQKIAGKLLGKYWGIYTELGDSFLENIQGLTTLKIYRSDQMKSDQMDEEAERFRKITMRVLIMQLNSISVMDLIAYVGAGIGSVVAISEFMKGNMQLWQVATVILLAAEFFIPLRLLGSFFHIAMNGMAACDRIFAFLKTEEYNSTDKIKPDGEGIFVQAENISFSYDENRQVLKNVSFHINPGESVVIAGVSGSGKSTIASLICGMYTDFSGKLEINGIDIRNISEEWLAEKITRVGFNSYIFGGTVRDNMLMGRTEASEHLMIETLKKVNLWDFLSEQDGLDTVITEQGSNLSGGQKQRLALARAILRNSEMYIFDEASSNIDAESENTIMKVIKEMSREKTVLFISHRLDNVADADRIYMLSEGVVEEYGTHSQLMLSGGGYSRMFITQRELCAKWEVK